jgi:hypothetical protein
MYHLMCENAHDFVGFSFMRNRLVDVVQREVDLLMIAI